MAKPSPQPVGSSVRHRIEKRAGSTWIALIGNLSEDADFTPFTKLAGPLVFDLSEIGRINSLGVRAWIYFVRELEAAGVSLTFERCAPVIVTQMTMILNFMGSRSHVKSVLVPYVCLSCNTEHLETVEVPRATPIDVAPAMPCTKCKSSMVLDELIETYTAVFGLAKARSEA